MKPGRVPTRPEVGDGERARSPRALLGNDAAYAALVERAPFGIYRSSLDGRILQANPALAKMLGYADSRDLVGLSLPDAVYADARQRRAAIASLHAAAEYQGIEADWLRKDGSIIRVELSGRALSKSDHDIIAFEGIAQDVTERRSLEERMNRFQKMEAVARLAGGIAHDFNNMLTAILGYAELLEPHVADRVEARNCLRELEASAERAAALTRQLLTFSRKREPAEETVSVWSVIEELQDMLLRLIGEDIRIETLRRSGDDFVRLDRSRLDQVVMNLVVNARDAMPQGGTITIESGPERLSEAEARRRGLPGEGDYVRVTVVDSGDGMEPEVLSHLFEPFYTTKEPGKGTGLGLATVYGIVTHAGGQVCVDSAPGLGTRFDLYLPATPR